jgi:hypothetical protein
VSGVELFEPTLLHAVGDEIDRIHDEDEKATALDTALGRKSELVEFVQQVFEQIFRDRLGFAVTDFSQDRKEEALLLQTEVKDKRLLDLLDSFTEVCDVWPEVLDTAYGGSPADFREFRTEFLPTFLERISRYAKALGDTTIEQKSDEVLERYQQMLSEVTAV